MQNNLVQINSKPFISRSAILTFKECKYKGYLTYFYEGHGIVPGQIILDLLIGTVVHRGLQHLLEHCRIHHPDGKFDDQCIDEAVEKAREVWIEAVSNGELALHSGEYDRLDEIIPEQECLWEGLIRAWAIRRLPIILEEYEILEVEHEEVFEGFSDLVTFLGKADGLFRRKADNKLIILSIKTASIYADVTERDILHDMQGVSEWVCIQDRIDQAWNFIKADLKEDGIGTLLGAEVDEQYGWFDYFEEKPEIYAVQYEYLIKGQRKEDPWKSGIYKQQSFLVHPYKMDSVMTLSGGSFGLSPSDYKWKHKGSGRLPKGWNKIDIWNDVGIKNWVEMLAMGKIQPEEGDPFEDILVTPPLVLRLPEELEEWKVSTKFYAERLIRGLDRVKTIIACLNSSIQNDHELEVIELKKQLQIAIWEEFSKDTTSCHNFFGRDCTFVKHCHELVSLSMGTESGIWETRRPHHELEKETFIKRGYLENE